jgi:tetratricopeptide (TPR) repeat protein
MLVEDLGVEPGQELRDLERAILAQEEWLAGEPQLPTRGVRVTSRRVVTLVLAEIGESRPNADPEAAQPFTTGQLSALEAVLENEGAVVRHFPDGTVMGVFGTPIAHEDDALRGLRAAVQLREKEITSRAAVDTGEVLARDDGTVSGPAIRRSTLLLAAAPPGDVLVGEATRRLTAHAAGFGPSVDLDDAPAWPLQQLVANAPALPLRLDVPFVGREQELAEIRAAFAQAKLEGTPRLVTIVGEPGIGKSRLARVLAEELGDEANVAVGRCLAYGEGITYSPLRDIIRVLVIDPTIEGLSARIAGVDDAAAIAGRLAGAVDIADEIYPVEEVRWAARRFFEALAQDRPLVLMLEDAHWAEQTLLDLLSHVVKVGEEAPIFLLCMTRPELLEQHPDWPGLGAKATSVWLQGLTREDAETVVSWLDLGALSENQQRGVVEAAEGNPLFLEQLTAFAQESGEDAIPGALPPSLQALLLARLDRLGPGERSVLGCAAVVGRDFSVDAVAELIPAEARRTLGRHLESLRGKGFVERGQAGLPFEDALRFRHVLFQDATYRSISKAWRAQLHENFATWLFDRFGSSSDEVVGYHLEKAYGLATELGVTDEEAQALAVGAGGRLSAAGEGALAVNDLPAAVNLLTRATVLQEAGGHPRIDLVVDLAVAQFLVGEERKALVVLDEAVKAADAAGETALAWRARIERNFVASHVEPGTLTNREELRAAEEAVEALESLGDDRALARAWRAVAQDRFWLGRIGSSLEASEHALRYARRAANRQEEIWTLRLRCMALWSGPVPAPEAARGCEEILATGARREAGVANGLTACALENLGALRAMQGQFEDARDLVDRALAIYEELGLTFRSTVTLGYHSASVHRLNGDITAAESDYRKAIGLFEKMGDRTARSTVTAYLATVLYDRGHYEEAERQAVLGEELAGMDDDYATITEARSVRAKNLARRGEYESGETMIAEAITMADATDDLDLLGRRWMDKAEVLQLGGDVERAASSLDRAIELFEQKGNVVLAARARMRHARASAARRRVRPRKSEL